MRTMKDALGLEIRPEHVEGIDNYDGLIIQCRPYLIFRLRSRQAQEWVRAAPGRYFAGLDELERQSQAPQDLDDDVWPAREYWTCKLVLPPRWPEPRRHYLWVKWLQETGDPMQTLSRIVAGVDFMALSAVEHYVYDD